MIKKCKVLFHNPHLRIILVDFDGIKIQLTGDIEVNTDMIYVKFEDGIADVVSEADYIKSLKPKVEKKPKKVYTAKEVVKSEAVEDETDTISE